MTTLEMKKKKEKKKRRKTTGGKAKEKKKKRNVFLTDVEGVWRSAEEEERKD